MPAKRVTTNKGLLKGMSVVHKKSIWLKTITLFC